MSASLISFKSRGVPSDPPAAAIKISTRPNFSATASTAFLTAASSRTSTTSPITFDPEVEKAATLFVGSLGWCQILQPLRLR